MMDKEILFGVTAAVGHSRPETPRQYKNQYICRTLVCTFTDVDHREGPYPFSIFYCLEMLHENNIVW
jgi:hypothetical protein